MAKDVHDLQSLPPEVSALMARMSSSAGGCFSLISITKGFDAQTAQGVEGATERLTTEGADAGWCVSLVSYSG
jgi:hypothetical protein